MPPIYAVTKLSTAAGIATNPSVKSCGYNWASIWLNLLAQMFATVASTIMAKPTVKLRQNALASSVVSTLTAGREPEAVLTGGLLL